MVERDKQATLPIYVSYTTFVTFLDWLREMRTIPSQIDSSLWRNKFSGAVGSQMMGGARFLKLLDGDNPSPRLEALVRADVEQRKELMRELMREAYGAELIDGLPRMTPKVLNEKLDALGTSESTHAKARSFFINAAKAVGLEVPGHIAKQARNKAGGSQRRNGKGQGTASIESTGPSRKGAKSVEERPPASDEARNGHTAGDVRVLELQGGVTLTLGISVGFFQLKGRDRAFVLKLLEQIDSYEEEAGPTLQPEQMEMRTITA
jgi:hypothetical protein